MRVEGTVQGVGFRPYVHRLAGDLGLAGFVLNDARGVVVEVEADGGGGRPLPGAPGRRGARPGPVERGAAEEMPPVGDRGFAILASDARGTAVGAVPADAATCADCLAELRDPADRRYRYPFVNCTACGPRFTIVPASPTTAPRTTMAGFAMCDALPGRVRGPRRPPLPRRAQRLPGLRPAVRLVGEWPLANDASAIGHRPRRRRGGRCRRGAIAAVKGLGGFHLACRADDEEAVAGCGRASGARRSRSR